MLVHTGQNYDYELNEIFFDGLGLRKPDHFLNAAGETAAQTIANVIARVRRSAGEGKARCVSSARRHEQLPGGDRRRSAARSPSSIWKRAIAASTSACPRRSIAASSTTLRDINLVYTEHARRYLLAEGVRPETVLKTGSPMKQVLTSHAAAIEKSAVLKKLGLERGKLFRREQPPRRKRRRRAPLRAIYWPRSSARQAAQLPVMVSTHPRTRKRLEALGKTCARRHPLLPPLGFADYVQLQKSAFCVLSDSGTLTEEASSWGLPA